ncbi:CMD domain-containing protein [Sabulicella glaciei]|uniref:Peroxidase-related enzyme n=1 Tax=Sabulicella glaciei TaxID=2984948 RepID=A0ABT3NYC0_9PROT|nr:peroxidase-related enzyme [Roseococcus sp. MDT2-1-1]MCW8087169.1 peroxidase-related enzyme [Roseococcus sp. MDT2-1-1]
MQDVVDEIAGIAEGSTLHALRAMRPDVRAATSGSEEAIFRGPSGLSEGERHAVAAHVARLHGDARLEARHAALAEESPRLDAMRRFADLLTLRTDQANPQAIRALEQAGLAPRDIVMLAQLVAFIAYATRMATALDLLDGKPGAGGTEVRLAPQSPGTADFGFTSDSLDWDSWVPVLDVAEATPEQLAILDASHASARTSPYYLLLVQEPAVLRERSKLFNTIMYGPRGASRAERELASVAESRVNGCPYCASVHAQRWVQLKGDPEVMERILREGVSTDMPPRLRAIVDFAVRLSAAPAAATQEDIAALREQGLADAEILDIAAAVAMFAWANRLMQTLGEPVRKATGSAAA